MGQMPPVRRKRGGLGRYALAGLILTLLLPLSPSVSAAAEADIPAPDLAETLRSYGFLEYYLTRDISESHLSDWGSSNRGKLHMTLLRSQYNPLRTGNVLLEDDLYCRALLYTLVSLSPWSDREELCGDLDFLAAIWPGDAGIREAGLLPDPMPDSGDVEELRAALLEHLSGDEIQQAGGADLIYGEYALQAAALDRLDAAGTASAEGEDAGPYIRLYRAFYLSLQLLYPVDSSQYAYLGEALSSLEKLSGGIAETPPAFEPPQESDPGPGPGSLFSGHRLGSTGK